MKKFLLIGVAVVFSYYGFSQDVPASTKKKDWSKVKLTGRANDHFMLQFGYTGLASKPDSIRTTGFSRTFNVYVMLDMVFKTDPRFSVAFGPGLGTDNIFFKETNITIADHLNPLRFQNVSDTNHFEKMKLTAAYLELPIELRFASNPLSSKKSFKAALGVKLGTLIDIHTKGKNWVNKNDKTVNGYSDRYIQKEKDKYFFNSTRFAGIVRVGYGNFTIFATYPFGNFIRDGVGPDLKPYSIGLALSGL
jgi:hypothetical protein